MQSLKNLIYILENEKKFKNVKKIFIINKILNKKIEKKIINEIKKHGFIYYVIPFNYDKFLETFNEDLKKEIKNDIVENKIKKFLKSIHYIIDINNARNKGLEIGFLHSKTVLIFDGNSFFTEELYNDFKNKHKKFNDQKNIFVFPVHRLKNYEQIFKKEEHNFYYEPQVGLENINSKFDPDCFYTDFEKIEFLIRHGVDGYWNEWKKDNQQYALKDFNNVYCKGIFRLPTHTNFDFNDNKLSLEKKQARYKGMLDLLDLAFLNAY